MRKILILFFALYAAGLLSAQTLPDFSKMKATKNNHPAPLAKHKPAKAKPANTPVAKNDNTYIYRPQQKYNAGELFFFIEDFFNNAAGWPLTIKSKRAGKIADGKLTIQGNVNESFYPCTKSFNIDLNKDFTCSALVQWSGGSRLDFFGLNFCSDASSNSFHAFCLSSQGKYQIRDIENNSGWKYNKDWKETSSANSGDIPNLLLIKKQGDFISFYINDYLVESFPFDGGFGNDFGFVAGGIQTVEFDDFKIKGTSKN